MRLAALGLLLAALLAWALPGCSTTPAQQEAIRKAWDERYAEMARECRRNGVGFANGGCVASGP